MTWVRAALTVTPWAIVGVLLMSSPGIPLGHSIPTSTLSSSVGAPRPVPVVSHISAVPAPTPVRTEARPHPAVPPTSLWNTSSSCRQRQAEWNQTLGEEGAPPLDVDHRLQSPCYIGHDEPGLNFLSNDSGSGSRVEFVVQLPSSGANAASAFSTFWLGMWLAGVRCSLLGESYLEIQINPPFSDVTTNGSANWTVQAPVWDLVPAGSCDPQCTNDTALTTIAGVGYCEDDAALSGVGTYTSRGWGGFAPGDRLNVTMVGAVNGTSGLSVFINDTSNLTRSLAWTYSASVSTSGAALTPFYDASTWTSGGWGYGINVEATWENCPEAQGPAMCDSYNGPSVNATGVPQVLAADYWNATAQSYSNPFAWTATTSSSGGCSGLVAPCYDYRTWGGTGQYPYWTLHAWEGRSWWTYGGAYPDQVNSFGGASGQFTPVGYLPVLLDPTSVYESRAVVGAGSVTVTASVADPNGVVAVRAGATWCFASASPTSKVSPGVFVPGPYETAEQGNWTLSFPTNGYTGTFRYWVQAESTSLVWGPSVYRNATVGAGSTCSLGTPAAPSFGVANITSAGIGYFLNWTESTPGVVNYTVWLNSTTNGTPTPYNAAAGQSTSFFVDAGLPNQTYNISIVAYNLAGKASAPSPWLLAPATLPTLGASLALLGPSTRWAPTGPVTFLVNASGGTAPYTYRILFGDGFVGTTVTNNTTVTFSHDYLGYFGIADVAAIVWDAQTEVAGGAQQLLDILATPLGVPSQAAAGDGWVNVTWSAPASPSGAVTHYTVYYTENPAWAWALGSFWPTNYSAPYDTFLWNTTASWLRIPVPDGATLYAQVIAWDASGLGQLPPASNATLVATPAVLTVQSVNTSSPGGPAPLAETLSAFVVGGTGDVITNASYSFVFGSEVAASVWPTGPSPNGTFWVNASYTFPSPGLAPVVLHVLDEFLDIAISTTTVSVAPGLGPSVNLTSTPGPLWVGETVNFSVVASSGSGSYEAAWNFGDGVTATGLTVNHTYTAPGDYGATAWVTDTGTGGLTVQPTTIVVYALPQVAVDTLALTNGTLSYVFTAVYSGGAGNATFVWTTSNNQFGRGPVFPVTFADSGAYAVQVTAVDDSGRQVSANTTVVAEFPGSSSSGTNGGFSSTAEAALAIVGVLAVLFLIAAVYFWGKSRRPPEESGDPTPPERA